MPIITLKNYTILYKYGIKKCVGLIGLQIVQILPKFTTIVFNNLIHVGLMFNEYNL